jgi:hypothetical protein
VDNTLGLSCCSFNPAQSLVRMRDIFLTHKHNDPNKQHNINRHASQTSCTADSTHAGQSNRGVMRAGLSAG